MIQQLVQLAVAIAAYFQDLFFCSSKKEGGGERGLEDSFISQIIDYKKGILLAVKRKEGGK